MTIESLSSRPTRPHTRRQFLIDTLPIRDVRNSLPLIANQFSNRHKIEHWAHPARPNKGSGERRVSLRQTEADLGLQPVTPCQTVFAVSHSKHSPTPSPARHTFQPLPL
jgi:hypothetical protein